MKKTVRWAVCGLGKISRRMVKAIRSVEGSEVVACVSSDKTRAAAYGKKHGIGHCLTYRELAENPSVCDAVYIATHMNAHEKPAVLFLNARIPVLCEKSFAVSADSARRIINAAAASDTLLMEAMWTRFLPASVFVQDLLKSGKLGKIIAARAKFEVGIGHGPKSRVFKKEVGGGSLLDVGVYPTTYTHMILGVPESVKTHGKLNKNGVDVNCNTVFTYEGGVKVNTRVSTEFMTLKEFYIIECEKGQIRVPSFYDARKVIVKYADGTKEIRRFAPRSQRDGFTWEIEHFNDLVRNGIKESPVMTHSVTMEVMELLEEQLKQLGVSYDN